MKCIYHNDADGHCSAAIIRLGLVNTFEPLSAKDFIKYTHGKTIEIEPEDIREGETVYIVDIALDDTIMHWITLFMMHNCKIVHIDHHIGGKRYHDGLTDVDKELYDSNVITFYREDVSAAMLTYIYSCMREEEREHPNDIPLDFAEEHSHFALYPDDNTAKREYRIPYAVRYIDDNDVWRHELEQSKYFALAYIIHDHHPLEMIFWGQLLYEDQHADAKVFELVNTGEILYKFQQKLNEQANCNGFEYEIDGFKGWVVNCPVGNSRLFGEKYDEYDFVCKYAYDGSIDKWRYTFYSKKDSEFDCAKVCKEHFNGGGHHGAAGGWLEFNQFQDKT